MGKRWLLLAFFVACHIYFFHTYRHFISPNELSRLLLTSAIVDDRTFTIDFAIQRYGNTQDKATFNGHYYSDKAIGVSILAIPGFLLLRAFESVSGIRFSAQTALFWVRVFTVTIPAILFLPLLVRYWRRLKPDSKHAELFLFLHLFGTIAFTYSSLFVSHYLLGCALFTSAFYLNEYRTSVEKPVRFLWLSGTFAGISLLLEFPALFPVSVLCISALIVLRKVRNLLYYATPIAIAVLMILGYNFAIFGTPWDVTYNHMSHSFHTAKHAQGFIGLGIPKPEALYGLFISRHHGLFFLSPFLLLSIPGIVRMLRSPTEKFSAKLFLGAILTITLVYSGFSYWIAGWNFGPRYLAPVIPFLSTAAFFYADQFLEHRVRRLLFYIAAIWSVVCITIGTITFPFPPDNLKDIVFFLNIPLLLHNATGGNLAGNPWGFYVLLLISLLLVIIKTTPNDRISGKRLGTVAVAAIFTILLLVVGHLTRPAPAAMEYYARGSVYLYLGRYPEAFQEMQLALSANPDPRSRAFIERRMLDLKRFVKR